jgi:glucose-1-phosphate adenylyltransferase
MIDFGHQVIPAAIENYHTYGHLFDGYWEDLGTVEAFFRANIDLTSSAPHFDFHDMTAPIYTNPRFLAASRIERCDIRQAVIAEGSVLMGARIANSIVGIRSVLDEDVVLERTLMMGADFTKMTTI